MKSGLTQSPYTEHLLALLQHKAGHTGGEGLEKTATRDFLLPRLCCLLQQDLCFGSSLLLEEAWSFKLHRLQVQ